MQRKADINIAYRAAEFLDALATRNGWTIRGSCEVLGLQPHAYYRWCSGECPGAFALQGLAKHGANVNYILTGKGDVWTA